MQTWQPAGTQQKRQSTQPEAESNWPSSPFQLQQVPHEVLFMPVDEKWSFLGKSPGKTLWGVKGRKQTDSESSSKEKSLHDTEWDSPVRYLGLKETTINIWLLKSWGLKGGAVSGGGGESSTSLLHYRYPHYGIGEVQTSSPVKIYRVWWPFE